MKCNCPELPEKAETVTYIDNRIQLNNGEVNPNYQERMVSHLVCSDCGGKIAISDMTLGEFLELAEFKIKATETKGN